VAGVPNYVPESLRAYAERVPDEVVKALDAPYLIGRLLKAEALDEKARSMRGALRQGFYQRADEMLTAPVAPADVAEQIASLTRLAQSTTGPISKGYRERADELATGWVEPEYVAKARRMLAATTRRSTTTITKFASIIKSR
jgi:hypothetical protein